MNIAWLEGPLLVIQIRFFFTFFALCSPLFAALPLKSTFCVSRLMQMGASLEIKGSVEFVFNSSSVFDVSDPEFFRPASDSLAVHQFFQNQGYTSKPTLNEIACFVDAVIPVSAAAPLTADSIIAAHRLGYYVYYDYTADKPFPFFENPAIRAIQHRAVIQERLTRSELMKDVAKMLQPEGGVSKYRVSVNTAFEQVVRASSIKPRVMRDGDTKAPLLDTAGHERVEAKTWLTEEVLQAYLELHQRGIASSVEVWKTVFVNGTAQEILVGGAFGLSIDGAFSGEGLYSSMDPDPENPGRSIGDGAGKIAAIAILDLLEELGADWVDTQTIYELTHRLGAQYITRNEYMALLRKAHAQGRELRLMVNPSRQIRLDHWKAKKALPKSQNVATPVVAQ